MINLFKEFLGSLSLGDYFFFLGSFVLVILFIYILYLMKLSEEEEKSGFDLKRVKKDIEDTYEPGNIVLTPYEEDQEKTAIISYDELVKNKTTHYNFDDEYSSEYDDLNIKKIDLNSFTKKSYEISKSDITLFSYEKEEEFLRSLKELQKKLKI